MLHSVCTAERCSHNYFKGICRRYAGGRRHVRWAVYLLCTIRIPLLFLSVGEAQHALAAGAGSTAQVGLHHFSDAQHLNCQSLCLLYNKGSSKTVTHTVISQCTQGQQSRLLYSYSLRSSLGEAKAHSPNTHWPESLGQPGGEAGRGGAWAAVDHSHLEGVTV